MQASVQICKRGECFCVVLTGGLQLEPTAYRVRSMSTHYFETQRLPGRESICDNTNTKADAYAAQLHTEYLLLSLFRSFAVPLLFSKCVYHGLKMRTCDGALSQTLKILEQEADRHRIGCSMYAHVVVKLKTFSNDPNQSGQDKDSRHDNPCTTHVKMLKREKEPDTAERLRIWEQTQIRNSLPVDGSMCEIDDC